MKVYVFETCIDPSEPWELGGICGSLETAEAWIAEAWKEIEESDGYWRVDRNAEGEKFSIAVFANYGNGEYACLRAQEQEVEK